MRRLSSDLQGCSSVRPGFASDSVEALGRAPRGFRKNLASAAVGSQAMGVVVSVEFRRQSGAQGGGTNDFSRQRDGD
jgi:hypothetical protein